MTRWGANQGVTTSERQLSGKDISFTAPSHSSGLLRSMHNLHRNKSLSSCFPEDTYQKSPWNCFTNFEARHLLRVFNTISRILLAEPLLSVKETRQAGRPNPTEQAGWNQQLLNQHLFNLSLHPTSSSIPQQRHHFTTRMRMDRTCLLQEEEPDPSHMAVGRFQVGSSFCFTNAPYFKSSSSFQLFIAERFSSTEAHLFSCSLYQWIRTSTFHLIIIYYI